MFSWLFGGNKDDKGPLPPSTVDMAKTVLESGVGNDDNAKLPTTLDKFDPTILERMAAAAKELSKSENAQVVVEIMREQERSWQAKYQAMQAESQQHTKEAENQRIRIAGEEQRRTLEEETEQSKLRSQYQDQLSRKRHEDMLASQRDSQAREAQMREQSAMRVEQERRKTLEYEAQLRQQTELVRVRAEAEAQGRIERDNKDIRNEQLVLQAEEFRTTVIEGIKTAADTIGTGIRGFLQEPTAVASAAAALAAVALGVYGARATANVAGQYAAARLGKPPLIRETSRRSVILHPWAAIRKLFSKPAGNPLDGIVLNNAIRERLQTITIATARARQYKSQFRHLMLHGPPGTGKTMFARRLAHQSGLEYAMLAGGDVGPLGSAAVTELHRVFDWAESSRKGVLIFIDEADAFLRKRGEDGDGEMSEEMRNALSTFLYRTGSPTTKFMLVVATNEPTAFDRAVMDRVDEIVEVPLPGNAERVHLLKQYFQQYLLGGDAGSKMINLQEGYKFDAEALAAKMEGFSGRQIAKLCRAWQAAAQASPDFTLTPAMIDQELKSHIAQLQLKSQWSHSKTPIVE